ncbi:MAG: thymidylate synthase [Patescibacteria group bacterium]|nr:thymidylate synthase [Patescibacteria group bacterium]
MIIIKNLSLTNSIKISWNELLKTKIRVKDESILYESPAIYEFLPYKLSGFKLDKNKRLEYNFNILKLFPEYDLQRIKEEVNYWENELILTDKIDKIVKHIRNNKFSRRAIISLWNDKYRENISIGAACTHNFYFRVTQQNKLEMHTHARANDLYNCVYVDLQFINFIHRLIAKKLGMLNGEHIHFIDALHIYKKDLHKIKNQTDFMKKAKIWN